MASVGKLTSQAISSERVNSPVHLAPHTSTSDSVPVIFTVFQLVGNSKMAHGYLDCQLGVVFLPSELINLLVIYYLNVHCQAVSVCLRARNRIASASAQMDD